MAFPQIVGNLNSWRYGNDTSDVVNLPSSVAAGDLIIVQHMSDREQTTTFPSPWVKLGQFSEAAGTTSVGYLIASGGETSVTVTKTLAERFTAIAIRISAASWHGTTPPEFGIIDGLSATPNSPSVTASWGSADNLWITGFGHDAPGAAPFVTAWPSSYTAAQLEGDSSGTSAFYGALAARELATATEDPGSFTVINSDDWSAYTVVVRPAAANSSMLSKVGTFLSGTGGAGSTVVVTGVGFVPKALILWMSGRTEGVDTVGALTLLPSIGFCTSPTEERCISGYSQDGVASSNTASGQHVTAAIYQANTTWTDAGSLGLQSFDADGFTMVVVVAFAVSRRIHFLALGGDSLTNAKVGHFAQATALGNYDVAGVGFQPDFVMFLGIQRTSDVFDATSHLNNNIGCAVSSTQQAVLCFQSVDDLATINSGHYSLDIECIAVAPRAGGTILNRQAFVSFLADGFRLNVLETDGPNANRWMYLALKGGNYRVGSLLTPTMDGGTVVETGFGFEPSALMFLSPANAESGQDTRQDHMRASIGAATSPTERVASAIRDQDNAADSNCTAAVEYDQCYIYLDNATDTITGLGDIQSIDADGFTWIQDDGDPAASFVPYIAFGPAAAPPPTGQPFMKRTQGIPTGPGSRDRPGRWN